ncbi:hypothetical protein CTAM01_06133 [Colletotrichum tamarilloi]|uniref:HNH nuclease domain-containing protein n=1 Tax=Colletotrichum tamarilloi TaxID=1209934 RepID=A0ABQ9RDP4_9PEZI|nr:uncharacterized protein CTAM01_06133 [Colletotrichum tamarilloi]KAK1501408.1 hypothetical protein CTAM01_06133 [Colletotrichum tamarilloi]
MASSAELNQIGEHPDGDSDINSVIDSQLTSALSDTGTWAKSHWEVLEMLADYVPLGAQDDTTKVLRLFASKLPVNGQLILLSEIKRHQSQPVRLRQLRDFLAQAILMPLKTCSKRKSEDIVSPVSASGSDTDRPDSLHWQLDSSNRGSKLRRDCLRRDGGQCVVTKIFDRSWVEKNFSSQMMPQGRIAILECAHIIPFSISDFDDRRSMQIRTKAKIWWALWRYFPDLKGKIGPDTVNQTGNAFTMFGEVHNDFGGFDFGFEQQYGSTTKYNIRWFCGWNPAYSMFKNYPESVEFTSTDPRVALPDPVFLDVHCRVGEILNEFKLQRLSLELVSHMKF